MKNRAENKASGIHRLTHQSQPYFIKHFPLFPKHKAELRAVLLNHSDTLLGKFQNSQVASSSPAHTTDTSAPAWQVQIKPNHSLTNNLSYQWLTNRIDKVLNSCISHTYSDSKPHLIISTDILEYSPLLTSILPDTSNKALKHNKQESLTHSENNNQWQLCFFFVEEYLHIQDNQPHSETVSLHVNAGDCLILPNTLTIANDKGTVAMKNINKRNHLRYRRFCQLPPLQH